MSATQQHLNISDIKDDVVLLTDGGGCLILQTSAVNFGLLSEREQAAIILSFAQMLNSLSFAIQIVVHSHRLDISSYINLLDQAQKAQGHPLLSQLILKYKQFIQNTIKENQVLDKNFFVVIYADPLELGLTPLSKDDSLKKIKTIILPRRDQLTRQLGRVGLKATQLNSQQLIELFYNIYNPPANNGSTPTIQIAPVTLQPAAPLPQTQPPPPPVRQPESTPALPRQTIKSNTHPFVVEELTDENT